LTVRFSVTISGSQTSFSTVCQVPQGAAQVLHEAAQQDAWQQPENNAQRRRAPQHACA
jgi:hypothetical protein